MEIEECKRKLKKWNEMIERREDPLVKVSEKGKEWTEKV